MRPGVILLAALALGGQLRVTPGPSEKTLPVYRQLRPGERRVEGRLERVGCPARSPVLFDVRMLDKSLVRYTAPNLYSVDYITYGPPIGGVQCGIRRPSDHVYVTYKPSQKVGTVIAIEFLGK